MISPASACADIESMRSMRAATGTSCPCSFTAWRRRTAGAPRARRLIPDKQHRVSRIGERRGEMMQHAAAGRHAARRDDDRRLPRRDEIRRLLRRGDRRHARGAEHAQLSFSARRGACISGSSSCARSE